MLHEKSVVSIDQKNHKEKIKSNVSLGTDI